MEAISVVGLIVGLVLCSWKLLSWLWVKPKRLERRLREQGLQGTPYTLFTGDTIRMFKIQKEAKSKPINLSDDFLPRAFAFPLQIVQKYGKNPFMWFGPTPRIIITDPELIKDVMNKNYDFTKPKSNTLINLLPNGLAGHDGDKWAKHRRIINPLFNTEKLKIMLPKFFESCNDTVSKWEKMLSSDGSCEVDVWPFLQDMTSDVISRTAFGSSFEEGRRIFQLLSEQTKLGMEVLLQAFIPGWRFLPSSIHSRMKEINIDIEVLLKGIIDKRENAIKKGEATKHDLLGILLESNHKEIQEHGNKENVGMTIEDVIDECKIFYFAGQETTSVLLVWTMVLLCRYPEWQKDAREEVFQIFCNKNPDFDGLNHLKIMTMIFCEVLRLYPPVLSVGRTVNKDMKLGNLIIPKGVELAIPICLIHHDFELWGDDAKEFKPERFSDGVLKATKGKVSFFPFGWGPRICIGQNFALLEAKMALSMILQRFSFELSPTYVHAPTDVFTLQPEFGAHIIIHRIN